MSNYCVACSFPGPGTRHADDCPRKPKPWVAPTHDDVADMPLADAVKAACDAWFYTYDPRPALEHAIAAAVTLWYDCESDATGSYAAPFAPEIERYLDPGRGWVDDDSTDPTNDAPTFTLPADWQPWCPTCGHSQPQFQCRDPFHLPDKEK